MPTVELTTNNLEQTITENDMVFIDFWASWCEPCKAFSPIYEITSDNHPDIVFAKVNTEDQQAIAAHFNIRSIPTLALFREQIMLFSQAGALPGEALEEIISKAKALNMDVIREEIARQQAEGENA